MKWWLTIGCVCLMLVARPQDEVGKLAQQLTANSHDDREKVTRIFHWITDNIDYRTPGTRTKVIGVLSRKIAGSEFEEDDSPLKPLNERAAETVLRNRVALCEGYSRLFAALCDHAGIRTEVIMGYARTNLYKPVPRFGVNHYWNAVYFEDQWHLLDATWASGYVTRDGGVFVREYDPLYFLADPLSFSRDHFPDDPRWALLPDYVVPEEFKHSPFKQKSFTKYSITSFQPSRGVIDASVGDVIELELETADATSDRNISPDLLIDSTIFTFSPAMVFLEPRQDGAVLPGVFRYAYKVDSPDVEWLYLKYNNDLVLRYKINIRKKKT